MPTPRYPLTRPGTRLGAVTRLGALTALVVGLLTALGLGLPAVAAAAPEVALEVALAAESGHRPPLQVSVLAVALTAGAALAAAGSGLFQAISRCRAAGPARPNRRPSRRSG